MLNKQELQNWVVSKLNKTIPNTTSVKHITVGSISYIFSQKPCKIYPYYTSK